MFTLLLREPESRPRSRPDARVTASARAVAIPVASPQCSPTGKERRFLRARVAVAANTSVVCG